MPQRPDRTSMIPDTLLRVEREVTVLLRRTLEGVWAQGYGDHPDVDRYTYSVLALLDAYGTQSLSELTGRLGLTKPTASRQVTRLTAAGLVATAPDGRAIVVELTAAGRDQVRHVRSGRTDRLGEVLEGWSGPDAEHLADLLTRLNEDLEAHRRLRA